MEFKTKDGWLCKSCKYFNTMATPNCQLCQNFRSIQWKCTKCSRLNKQENPILTLNKGISCEVCKHVDRNVSKDIKMEKTKVMRNPDNTWNCPLCTFLNSAHSISCDVCNVSDEKEIILDVPFHFQKDEKLDSKRDITTESKPQIKSIEKKYTDTNLNIHQKSSSHEIPFNPKGVYIIILINLNSLTIAYFKSKTFEKVNKTSYGSTIPYSGEYNIETTLYGDVNGVLERSGRFIVGKWLSRNGSFIFDEIVIVKAKNHPVTDDKILNILAKIINSTFDKFIYLPSHYKDIESQVSYACSQLKEMY